MSTLKELVNQQQQENREGLTKASLLTREEELQTKATRELEAQKWEEFKEIVKDERFMRYEHFRKLNVGHHILIHLSVKNTGKTTELYRLIRDCISRGKKFIYGRVTVAELKTEIEKFATDENSPCVLMHSMGQFFFYLKDDIRIAREIYPDKMQIRLSDLRKLGAEPVGKAMSFMNANVLGSGNYTDYDTIFFDEIVSYTPRNMVNGYIMSNWSVAISTILRNKNDLKIIMMGNLRANMKAVPILTYYGISVSDNLRIVKRSMDGGEPCTILYVNSGSLYGNSINSQASVAHHAPLEERLFLAHNKLINTSDKVLTPELVSQMEPCAAIAVTYKNIDYVLELRKHQYFEDDDEFQLKPKFIYALITHKLKLTTPVEVEVVTNDWAIAQKYHSIRRGGAFMYFFRYIFRIFSRNLLYYDSLWSLETAANIINYLQPKLMKYG